MGSQSIVSLDQSKTPWTPQENGGPAGTALLSAVVANGAGKWIRTDGYKSLYIEVVESGGGTATLTLQGTLNTTNIYTIVTAPVDGQVALTYTTTISVTASMAHYYNIRDAVPLLRANISAIAGGAIISVNLYALPD